MQGIPFASGNNKSATTSQHCVCKDSIRAERSINVIILVIMPSVLQAISRILPSFKKIQKLVQNAECGAGFVMILIKWCKCTFTSMIIVSKSISSPTFAIVSTMVVGTCMITSTILCSTFIHVCKVQEREISNCNLVSFLRIYTEHD